MSFRSPYQQVKQLQSARWKIGQIARKLDINPTTVRKYFYAAAFPERSRRLAGKRILNPYLSYLEAGHKEGCQNALQLWREIDLIPLEHGLPRAGISRYTPAGIQVDE